jgi:flagellar M-ring protein FliF
VSELISQVKNIWTQMDTTKRVATVVVLLLVAGSILFMIRWIGSPRYELLYSRLNEQDRSEIIAKLDELRIPYRTSASGGLEVPNALSVRANLLKAGIPRGGVVGWEIFDKNSFSATDFTNEINRQRAIAGELSRTLQQVEGIHDAKVILNMPDSTEYLFADDKPEGTASVQLQLRAPGVLTMEQVEAIANLVAASTGLKRENITIIDNYANDLTAMLQPRRNGKPALNSVSDAFSIKSEYETMAEKRIESMLAKVFGFSKAVVRVNADLDLDYQEVKSETFGDKGVPRSEQEKTEESQGSSGTASGIPGTDTNITQYKTDENLAGGYRSDKSERTVNYEINKVEEFRIATPGKVRRMSVGVWVDGNLPEAVRQKVLNTVGAAIGYSEERGDRLTVETISFTQPAQEQTPKPDYTMAYLIGAGLLLLLIIGGLIVRSRMKPKPEPEPGEVGSTIDLVADEAVTETAAAEELSLEEQLKQNRQAELERYAKQNPEDMAVLLKTWLSEDN